MNDAALEQERKKRIAQRGRAAQLVAVALFAGFVGAAVGYFKGEVAVIEGNSQVASALLAPEGGSLFNAPEAMGQLAATAQSVSRLGGSGNASAAPAQFGGSTGLANTREGNLCWTTYVSVDTSGNPTFSDAKMCYEKSPAKAAIEALASCIATKTNAAVSTTELIRQLCVVPAKAPSGDVGYKPDSIKALDAAANGAVTSMPIKIGENEYYATVRKNTGAAKKISGKNYGLDYLGHPRELKVKVPPDCAAEEKKVLDILIQTKEVKGVSENDAKQCAFKGASVCVQGGAGSKTYNCVPAGRADSAGNVNAPPGSFNACVAQCKASGSSDYICGPKCSAQQVQRSVNNLAERLRSSNTQPNRSSTSSQRPQQCPPGTQSGGASGGTGIASMVTGIVSRMLGGGSAGQAGCVPVQRQQQQQQPPQCPNGYTLSTAPQAPSSGAIVYRSQSGGQSYSCVPDAKAPTCVFNVSNKTPTQGSKVTLTWDAKNTEGGRVMLKDGSREGRIEAQGSQEITVSKDVTYTLVAYNRAGDTKECKVDIKVSGGGDESTRGKLPPRVSCAPSIVKPGRSAKVTWQCPIAAKKSAGEGLLTGGDLSGEKTVTPDGNTEYTISCFSDADANVNDETTDAFLGKRTCSVRVAEPTFDMIAYPESAGRGDRVRISWGSLFMQSCEVTGPRGFEYNQPSGVVVTEPFSEDETVVPDRTITAAVYTIVCESVFGDKSTKDVTVEFDN